MKITCTAPDDAVREQVRDYGRGAGTYRHGTNATGWGDGFTGDCDGDGDGWGVRSVLYKTCPFGYLTYEGHTFGDTFDNFTFHLQVEQLVHRRMG